MMIDSGRSLRGGLSSSTEPEVSALRASIPSAETLAKMGHAAENELLSELGHYDAGKAAWLAWQLAELGEMPDEEIDTSDIPEVTDWTSAVRGKFAPASAIETRQGGDVQQAPSQRDESAVPNGETPKGHPEQPR